MFASLHSVLLYTTFLKMEDFEAIESLEMFNNKPELTELVTKERRKKEYF